MVDNKSLNGSHHVNPTLQKNNQATHHGSLTHTHTHTTAFHQHKYARTPHFNTWKVAKKQNLDYEYTKKTDSRLQARLLTCVLAMLTNTFAAALSTWIARKIVAPSLVTLMPPSRLPMDCKILSMPMIPQKKKRVYEGVWGRVRLCQLSFLPVISWGWFALGKTSLRGWFLAQFLLAYSR